MNPDDGYIAYIVNPKSGASSGKRMVGEFRKYLRKRGFDVRVSFSRSLEHIGELAASAAADDNCGMVVAAGGDGTIREIVHSMIASEKKLLIIPSGTENLLANELGFSERTKKLIRTFEQGQVRQLDLGSANGRFFTSVAGFGFDAEVVKRVNDQRSGNISHLDYFWPLWRTFWGYKFPNIKVVIDGDEVFDGQGLAFVGNISRYAIGIEILQDADFGDGLLDVCIYKCGSRIHMAKHALMTVLKHHTGRADVIYRQGKSIHISSSSPNVHSEIDGDPGPELPMKIEVIPQAVKVLVPPGAKPAGVRTRLMRILE